MFEDEENDYYLEIAQVDHQTDSEELEADEEGDQIIKIKPGQEFGKFDC